MSETKLKSTMSETNKSKLTVFKTINLNRTTNNEAFIGYGKVLSCKDGIIKVVSLRSMMAGEVVKFGDDQMGLISSFKKYIDVKIASVDINTVACQGNVLPNTGNIVYTPSERWKIADFIYTSASNYINNLDLTGMTMLSLALISLFPIIYTCIKLNEAQIDLRLKGGFNAGVKPLTWKDFTNFMKRALGLGAAVAGGTAIGVTIGTVVVGKGVIAAVGGPEKALAKAAESAGKAVISSPHAERLLDKHMPAITAAAKEGFTTGSANGIKEAAAGAAGSCTIL